MGAFPFDSTLDELRHRTSAKWSLAGGAGIPMWVAEMDVSLAPPIAQALHAAVRRSDTGYAGDPAPVFDALGEFARSRWGWDVDAAGCRLFPDLYAAGRELLMTLTPGAPVIITPPVYNSYVDWLADAGVRAVPVPLRRVGERWRLDLPGIETACARGARAVLISHPHNPTGTLHTHGDLVELAEIAARHGAIVLADEIFAPLAFPGHTFVPFLTVSDTARRVGIAMHSASKAWNIAGLKCAVVVRHSAGPAFDGLTAESAWSVGQFGTVAAVAAYRDSGEWLDSVRGQLAASADHVTDVLRRRAPRAGFTPPEAGFLGWVDLSAYDLPGEAADVLADRAGVIVSAGSSFAPGWSSWIRLNFGTSTEILDEALDRIVDVLDEA